MSRYGRTLMIRSRAVDTALTPYRRFRLQTKGRGESGLGLGANHGGRRQRLGLKDYIAPYRADRPDRGHRIAVDGDREAAGVAGAHRQSRPVRDLIALANFEDAREQHTLVCIAYLDPAVGDRMQHDAGRGANGDGRVL